MIDFTVLATGSKGNCYLLSDGHTELMLEAGIPKAQARKRSNFSLTDCSACLVTHRHQDHAGHVREVIDSAIDVHAPLDVIDHCHLSYRCHPVTNRQKFKIGTWSIMPLEVPHDVPNMAYLLANGESKCLFMIDTPYCPYLFKGLTHIFIGVNYDLDILDKNVEGGGIHPALANRIKTEHCSLSTALDFFRAQDLSSVEEIHILHCSENNMDRDRARELIQRATGKLVIM